MMKKRWATGQMKGNSRVKSKSTVKKSRRVMSPAARKRISAAMKKRWAERKKV